MQTLTYAQLPRNRAGLPILERRPRYAEAPVFDGFDKNGRLKFRTTVVIE